MASNNGKYELALADMRAIKSQHDAVGGDSLTAVVAEMCGGLSDDDLAWRISAGIQTAKTDPLTFEIMRELAVMMLRQRRGVTLELADWIAGVLTDKIKRPPGKVRKLGLRDLFIGHAIWRGVTVYGLTPTRAKGTKADGRKDEKPKRSACDAAAKVWKRITFPTAVNAWLAYKKQRDRSNFATRKNRMH